MSRLRFGGTGSLFLSSAASTVAVAQRGKADVAGVAAFYGTSSCSRGSTGDTSIQGPPLIARESSCAWRRMGEEGAGLDRRIFQGETSPVAWAESVGVVTGSCPVRG
eukprot:scaffold116_cov233-Pinguiococcus_pyrenoidosus.AAC.5